MVYNIRGAVENCTESSVKLYYVLIRGRVYTSWRGTTIFRSKAGAVQSVMLWSEWSKIMRKLATEQYGFYHPDRVEYSWGVKTVKQLYLEEYLEFEKTFTKKAFEDQVEIKEFNLPA